MGDSVSSDSHEYSIIGSTASLDRNPTNSHQLSSELDSLISSDSFLSNNNSINCDIKKKDNFFENNTKTQIEQRHSLKEIEHLTKNLIIETSNKEKTNSFEEFLKNFLFIKNFYIPIALKNEYRNYGVKFKNYLIFDEIEIMHLFLKTLVDEKEIIEKYFDCERILKIKWLKTMETKTFDLKQKTAPQKGISTEKENLLDFLDTLAPTIYNLNGIPKVSFIKAYFKLKLKDNILSNFIAERTKNFNRKDCCKTKIKFLTRDDFENLDPEILLADETVFVVFGFSDFVMLKTSKLDFEKECFVMDSKCFKKKL